MRRTLRLPANSWSVWVREVLSVPDPGAGLSVLGASEDIVKGAAVRFVEEMVFRSGRVHSDLFGQMNRITSMIYERT